MGPGHPPNHAVAGTASWRSPPSAAAGRERPPSTSASPAGSRVAVADVPVVAIDPFLTRSPSDKHYIAGSVTLLRLYED